MPDNLVGFQEPVPGDRVGVKQFQTEIDMEGGPNARANADQQSADDKKLIERLKKTHPLYQRYSKTWQAAGDISLNRLETTEDKQRYLVRGRSELDIWWDTRCQLSQFLPETPSLLGDFVGAVFKSGVKREFKAEEKNPLQQRIQSFINSAGPDGTPLSKFMEDVGKNTLVFGSTDILLDFPEEKSPTPHAVMYSPESRIDWEIGDDGLYKWVKYVEATLVQDGWEDERQLQFDYRVIIAPDGEAKGRIESYRIKQDSRGRETVETLEPVDYDFDTIPVRTIYWDKIDQGIGDSWVKPMVEADIKIFRMESDLNFDVFQHSHPTLKAWLNARMDESGEDVDVLAELKLGGAWAIQLNPGDDDGTSKEDLEYLTPFTPGLDLQSTLIAEVRRTAQRLSGNSTDQSMGISSGSQIESGVALAYQQAQKSKNHVRIAQSLEEIEWQMLELVAGLDQPKGFDVKGLLEVSYPDKFDQRHTIELDRDVEIAKETQSETLLTHVLQGLAAKLAGPGTSAEKLKKINDEIAKACPQIIKDINERKAALDASAQEGNEEGEDNE